MIVIGIISLVTGRSPLVVGIAMLAAVALAAPFAVLAWRRFTYRVKDGRAVVRAELDPWGGRVVPAAGPAR